MFYLWVAYKLGNTQYDSLKRPGRFNIDKRTSAKVSHKDYTGSGYDRGHMAPNYGIVTRFGKEAQLQTFLMSNICPQKPKLNRQVWRLLEEKIARTYAKNNEVWVIMGPIFDRQIEKLDSGVETPDELLTTVDKIEEKTGLDFFHELEDKAEDQLENFKAAKVW